MKHDEPSFKHRVRGTRYVVGVDDDDHKEDSDKRSGSRLGGP